jgi:WD40 repeat protein
MKAFAPIRWPSLLCLLVTLLPAQGIAASAILGREAVTFSLPRDVSAIAWSPNFRYLAVSYDRDSRITSFDLRTKRRLWTAEKLMGIDPPPQRALRFSLDSSLIFTSSAVTLAKAGGDKTVSILSAADGHIERTLAYQPAKIGQAAALEIAVARNGPLLFVIPGMQGQVIAYDTHSWEITRTYNFDERGISSAFSHVALDENRNLLWIAEGGGVTDAANIQLRRLDTGEQISKFEPFQVAVTVIQLNPKTGELVAGGTGNIQGRRDSKTGEVREFSDDPQTLVRAFDPVNGGQTRIYSGPGGSVGGLSISPDGSLIAASKSRSAMMPPELRSVLGCVAPCGTPSPAYLLIWDANTGELLDSRALGSASLGDVAFSPDGKSLAYVVNSTVHIVEVTR